MAYSKGVEDFFDKKNPKIFRFVTLPLEIREKTKLPSWKFPKIVLQCLKIPSRKTKLHKNSLWLLQTNTLGNFMSSTLLFGFFLE